MTEILPSDDSARAVHARILKLDGHLDAPIHFTRTAWSFADAHDHQSEIAQIDIPRMIDNLDGGFFVIYTSQGTMDVDGYASALSSARQRSNEIDDAVVRFGDKLAFARTADDVERLHAAGKLIVLKSMENSYPLGEDLSLLAEFAKRGVRLAGPVHSRTNQLADSSTDDARWNGLSPLGRRWVAEANRLGIVIDPSHASDDAFDEMLALSHAPLLLSHSGSRFIHDAPRNLDDDRLRALARRGGVICFTTIYLSEFLAGPKRFALMKKLNDIGSLTPDEQTSLTTDWRTLDQDEPMWTATFETYVKGLLHVIDVAGVDHVAFGADFDGGGGIPGLDDVTALPRITDRLLKAGLTETGVTKLWSGNILRVLRAAEDCSDGAPSDVDREPAPVENGPRLSLFRKR